MSFWQTILTPFGTPDATECGPIVTPQFVTIDAQIASMKTDWNPSGFYTSDQIREIVTQVAKTYGQAFDALQAAPSTSSDGDALVKSALNDMTNTSLNEFTAAANDADAKGVRVIDAAGLKPAAIKMMQAARSGMYAAAIQQCSLPAYVAMIADFQSVFDAVANAVKAVVGVVLAVGEALIKVPYALGTLITVAKFAIPGLVGLWLFFRIKKWKNESGSFERDANSAIDHTARAAGAAYRHSAKAAGHVYNKLANKPAMKELAP